MKTNQPIGNRDRKVSLKLYVVTVIVLSILCTSILASSYFGHSAPALPKSLDVEIQPKGLIKAYVNETITLSAIVHNGTSPFTYQWSTSTDILPLTFQWISGDNSPIASCVPFTQPSNATVTIGVRVFDAHVNFGYASTMVVDPASINIYLDDLPATATYTIKTDDTNYWAVRYDGYKAWESTDARTIIQNSINALGTSGGEIHLQNKNFVIATNPIVIDGDSHGAITITGEGWQRYSWATPPTGTVLTASASNPPSSIFSLTDGSATQPTVKFDNFAINCNNQNTHGIYISRSGSPTGNHVIFGSYFDRLYISGVKYGYDGFYSNGAMMIRIGSLFIETKGDGLVFEETAAINTGDVQVDQLWVRIWDNSGAGWAYALKILGPTDHCSNYQTYDWMQVWSGEADSTAVYVNNGWHVTFSYLGIEGGNKGVHLAAGSKMINVLSGYIYVDGNFIQCDANSQQNNFENIWVTGYGGVGTVITDASEYYNTFRDIKATYTPAYSSLGTFHANTRLYGRIGNTFAQMQGSATIPSGTNSIVVVNTISMPRTPFVWVTGTNSEVATLYVDTISATAFTIHNIGTTTTSRIVYWFADVNNIHSIDK